MQVKIDLWQFVPPEADEEPGMPTYRIAGTVDGKPYCGDLSMEIDGRDIEYEKLWGVDILDNFDAWDFLQDEIGKTTGLIEHYNECARVYYATQ